jgi:hypothetical protein
MTPDPADRSPDTTAMNPLRRLRFHAAAAAMLALAAAGGCAQTPVAPAMPPAPATPSASAMPSAPATSPAPASAPAPAAKAEGHLAPGEHAPPEAASAGTGPVAPLAWLEGCWQGIVNQREFREQWLPLRGGMLVGAGQQTLRGKMQDYEYLRIEARADGVYFTQFSGDGKETSFKLEGTSTDQKDTIFTFANTADAFPARLVYRRGTDGWLYETIEGKLGGSDKRVIYPLRRIGCESGELILK